jgi:aminomuconate-semialdehyde/2-hydroxymuconate-6-semialdehyde dehydrogenase
MQTIRNFIGGEFREPNGGGYLETFEPATGRAYARVPDSDAQDVDAAVAAAQGAFTGWSSTPAPERARLLMRLADLIDRDVERLARAESIDSGKPLALARSLDIPRSAVNFRFFAQAATQSVSEFHETDGRTFNYTLRRPRGVAGLISPWNLPLYLLTWKIAPAVATGNTCVAKPSEVTPMTAYLLGELVKEAGIPPGVINVVHGTGAKAGAALVTHPGVPAVSFTGSTGVGKWIAEHAGPMFKRLSLELGGKNPFIVFDDAKLPEAIDTAARAAFTNQGQICLCGSRLLVQRSVFDRVVQGVVERARALRVGDPLDEGTQIGSLVSAAHREKVASYVELAKGLGGQVLCGGRPPAASELADRVRDGASFLPTVIRGLDPRCRVEQEEIFGPVVTVQAFEDEEEALRLANGTCYGLAATVWTSDLSRAHRVASRLESGVVWVNTWMVRDLRTPFGGTKQSGVGREGGAEAMRFFTEPRNVCVVVG